MNSQEEIASSKIFDEDIVHSNHKDVIMVLNGNAVLLKKLQCVDILVSIYLPSMELCHIETEILAELMPAAKEILDSIFSNAVELAFDNQHEKCMNTLVTIQEYLQMAMNLLQSLDDMLMTIMKAKSVEFANVRSLLHNVSKTLHVTFLHCKESNNFYTIYFDSLEEILNIFKKAQGVHFKLLRLLEDTVVINTIEDSEIVLLKNILDDLVNIGLLLSGMNIKSMTDNWKSFTNLTQRYCRSLESVIDLKGPIDFFTCEIIKTLENVLEMDTSDLKLMTHTLKIANFLVKVMSKLCTTFWSNLKLHFEKIWEFFVHLYSFSVPVLKQKRAPENVVELLKTYLIAPFDKFLEKLSLEVEFYHVDFIGSFLSKNEHPFGFVLVTSAIFKILVSDSSKTVVNDESFQIFFIHFFTAIGKCYPFFILEGNTYSELVILTAVLILNLNNTNFLQIENLISKSLFNKSIWCNLFAQDLWCSVIRQSHDKYGFDVLCHLVDYLKDVLKSRHSHRPEQVISENLISSVYLILAHDYQQQFITLYPIHKNAYIWRCIGLENLPNNSTQLVEHCLNNVVSSIEKFESGRCTRNDFEQMIDLMHIASTIPFEEVYFDLNKLNSTMLELWNFETDEDLLEYMYFDIFLEEMFALTNSILWRFRATQFLQIAETIKTLTANNNISKLLSLKILDADISKFCSDLQSKDAISSNIEDILVNLFSSNVVIKVKMFELLIGFLKTPIFRETIQRLFQKLPKIKMEFSKFTNKKYESNNCLSVCEVYQSYEYNHECVELNQMEQQAKKYKLDEISQIDVLVNNMKKSVNALKKELKRKTLSNVNVADISSMIAELHSCL